MNVTKSIWSERIRDSVIVRRGAAWLVMAVALGIVATFLPLGFDYVHVFHPHIIPIFYVPWTDGLMYLLPWPILVSATVMALVIAVQRHGGSPLTIALAILSLPTMWTLLIGQLEGVALLGLLLLPWSLPVIFIEHRHKIKRWLWAVGLLWRPGLSRGIKDRSITRFQKPWASSHRSVGRCCYYCLGPCQLRCLNRS